MEWHNQSRQKGDKLQVACCQTCQNQTTDQTFVSWHKRKKHLACKNRIQSNDRILQVKTVLTWLFSILILTQSEGRILGVSWQKWREPSWFDMHQMNYWVYQSEFVCVFCICVFSLSRALSWENSGDIENSLCVLIWSPTDRRSFSPTIFVSESTFQVTILNFWFTFYRFCILKPPREGSRYQIRWIFGKIPNGLRHPPPHFWKIILQFFYDRYGCIWLILRCSRKLSLVGGRFSKWF